MIEAVIFDIDGTLVDSVDLHAEAWRVAFKKFGKDVGFDAVRSQIGKGADQLLPVFLSSAELAQFGKALDEYRGDLYKRDYLPKVKAFPKVRELFQRIRQDGKRIALASSAKGDELKTYKAIAQIEDLIHAETSSDSAAKSKPHPDIFDSALEELGDVPRGHVSVVGDTPMTLRPPTKRSYKPSECYPADGMKTICAKPAAVQFIATRPTCSRITKTRRSPMTNNPERQ